MKLVKTLTTTLVLTAVSFGALAAEELTREQAEQQKLIKIGSVSTDSQVSAPTDAKGELSRKADELGGRYYVIIAGRQTDGGKVNATADVYK